MTSPTPPSSFSAKKRILQRIFKSKVTPSRAFDPLPTPKISDTAQAIPCQAPFFEKAQLERIVSCGFGRSPQEEVARLTATHQFEGQVEEYELGPCIIAGGQIFAEDATYYIGNRSPIKAMQAPLRTLGPAKLASTTQGIFYFGHWLRDDCTLFELLRKDSQPYALRKPDWPDAKMYEAAFDQTWDYLDFAWSENLTIYRELGFNRDKISRFGILRDKLRAAHPQHKGGQIVYLSRGKTSSPRNMSNAASFEAAMVDAGIKIVAPETDPDGLLKELLNARMIITIEGSQAAHGVYMLQEGGSLLILQPPERFYNAHQEWTRMSGMNYGTVVGTKDQDSFQIDPNEVLSMVARLKAAG